ncbi:MAG: hypothetical protein QME96_12305 [Myxococcota bacterium]|nr:hypothetical protein [Myxococcota bacterium]
MILGSSPRWWWLVALGVVALPALLVALVWKAVDAAASARKRRAPEIVCPAGHRSPAVGRFRCGACRAEFQRRAFDACPVCGARPAYVSCPACGLSVKGPAQW